MIICDHYTLLLLLFQQTLETLKKQCKDEIHTRGVLGSRITSDGAELVKSQVEAKQKKETLAKTVVEIEEQLKVVVEKVDKLRDVYNAKKQVRIVHFHHNYCVVFRWLVLPSKKSLMILSTLLYDESHNVFTDQHHSLLDS